MNAEVSAGDGERTYFLYTSEEENDSAEAGVTWNERLDL